MFLPDMKMLIKYSLELDIDSLETKEGYAGAPILRISTKNIDTKEKIIKFLQKSGIEYNVLYDKQKKMYDIFSVYGEDTIDNSFYQLKFD